MSLSQKTIPMSMRMARMALIGVARVAAVHADDEPQWI